METCIPYFLRMRTESEMVLSLWVLTLLLLCLALDAWDLTANYTCLYFQESVEVRYDCSVDFDPPVRIIGYVSDLNRPLRYLEAAKSALCFNPEYCKYRYAEYLRVTVIKNMKNHGMINDIKPFLAVNAIFLHQVSVNMNQYGNAMDVSLLEWQWKSSPTVSVVLMLDPFLTNQQMIDALWEDLGSFDNVFSVVLYFGTVLTEGRSTALYAPFLEALSNVIPGIDRKFYAFHHEGVANIEIEGDWIPYPLPYSPVDYRSVLANVAYSSQDTDYYILSDCTALQTSGWLAPPLSPFLFREDLHPNLGVSMNSCPGEVRTVSALSRLHFQIFSQLTWYSFSPAITAMLLQDTYSIIQSLMSYCRPNSKVIESVNFRSIEQFDLYVDQLHQMRMQLMTFLNTHIYSRNPIAWTLQTITMHPRDQLYEAYCGLVGCSLTDTTLPVQPREPHPEYRDKAKIAYITSLFGTYETQLHPFVRQTIPADFICFTDQPDIPQAGGWIVDTHPYHWDALQHDIDHNFTHLVNSLHNNKHPFNIAKYYKTNFHRIPRLAQYDVVVWIDASIRISNPNASEILTRLVVEEDKNFLIFQEYNGTNLEIGLNGSLQDWRYSTTSWFGHPQPLQRLKEQQHDYYQVYHHNNSLEHVDGYTLGTWMTCFVGMDMRKKETVAFLEKWNEHIMRYSLNDQLSLIFLAQYMKMYPYTLPDKRVDNGIYGAFFSNNLYVKLQHGGLVKLNP